MPDGERWRQWQHGQQQYGQRQHAAAARAALQADSFDEDGRQRRTSLLIYRNVSVTYSSRFKHSPFSLIIFTRVLPVVLT